jgi:hypothetical protein
MTLNVVLLKEPKTYELTTYQLHVYEQIYANEMAAAKYGGNAESFRELQGKFGNALRQLKGPNDPAFKSIADADRLALASLRQRVFGMYGLATETNQPPICPCSDYYYSGPRRFFSRR